MAKMTRTSMVNLTGELLLTASGRCQSRKLGWFPFQPPLGRGDFAGKFMGPV